MFKHDIVVFHILVVFYHETNILVVAESKQHIFCVALKVAKTKPTNILSKVPLLVIYIGLYYPTTYNIYYIAFNMSKRTKEMLINKNDFLFAMQSMCVPV